jgi:ZIP family zinc transporter
VFAHSVLVGFLGSLVAGVATGFGALPILLKPRWSEQAQRLMLATAGGVMLGATLMSLLEPAIQLSQLQTGSKLGGVASAGGGLLVGAFSVWGLHQVLPHEHFVKGKEGAPLSLGRNWMLVLAIALHNLPEGMSVGVAYGSDTHTGFSLMLAIALQNLPEGLAVAAALVADGVRPGRAFWIALGTGLIEPLGGLLGASFVALSRAFLPHALAGAAGAMLFVILGEIVPETTAGGHERESTFAALFGFVAMMLLDVAFT